MELSDEAKRQVLEASQPIKDAARAETLEAKDMGPREAVDNYEDRGKALDAMREEKRQDALDEKKEPQAPDTLGPTRGNAFEQALAEKLQEVTPASLGSSHDIDH